MAEKLSKSILRNLKGILHRDPKKPSTPAPKKAAAPKPTAREREPSPPSADPGSTPEAPEAKPDPKKPKNQPWYRHRQRW